MPTCRTEVRLTLARMDEGACVGCAAVRCVVVRLVSRAFEVPLGQIEAEVALDAVAGVEIRRSEQWRYSLLSASHGINGADRV